MQYRDRLTVIQAYRFALDPTPGQVRVLLRHAGAAHLAYNWGLARVKANLDQRGAERSYGIAEVDLTPPVGWSLYAMRKEWNQVKRQVAPWWVECSNEAYNTGLDQLARALKNWADSRNGERKGRRVGFPRFKSRRKSAPSVRFTTGTIRLEDERHHVRLPRLGRIKTHESTRKLQRRIADGRARILSATVRSEAGRWFASFTVEVERAQRVPARPGAVVGVDLGIKTLATFSYGRPAATNPKHYVAARRKLARSSRAVSRKQGPDRRTGHQPSGRWRKANTARNRVTKLRGDAIKTMWNGGRLIVADRWYPSSKTCSGWGVVNTKLRLSERVFTCTTCGLVLDRDANAALNLASLVEHVVVAGSGPETLNGRGADPKTRPVRAGGHETSTPHRAAPARIRRGPSPSNERITEIQ